MPPGKPFDPLTVTVPVVTTQNWLDAIPECDSLVVGGQDHFIGHTRLRKKKINKIKTLQRENKLDFFWEGGVGGVSRFCPFFNKQKN